MTPINMFEREFDVNTFDASQVGQHFNNVIQGNLVTGTILRHVVLYILGIYRTFRQETLISEQPNLTTQKQHSLVNQYLKNQCSSLSGGYRCKNIASARLFYLVKYLGPTLIFIAPTVNLNTVLDLVSFLTFTFTFLYIVLEKRCF
jgi:hypothetical protein